MLQQSFVFAVLALALALFVWGKFRHDLVALGCLILLVLVGIVPADDAFAGFGHPAVITVAAVLVASKGLEEAGLADFLAKRILKLGGGWTLQATVLCGLVCLASAFMNNVGALAVFMPVAIFVAKKGGRSPSLILMPLAFASLLGGMMTMIGTPPNMIVAAFRADVTGEPFGLFAFAPVGAGLSLAGVAFAALAGWRLLPKRAGQGGAEDRFHIQDYITEVRVGRESKLKGATVGDIKEIGEAEVALLGLLRNKRRIHAPDADEPLKANDILIIEADSADLETFLKNTGARLVGGRKIRKDAEGSKDIAVVESVVMADSPLAGQTAAGMGMRTRYGVNLLAIARRDKQIRQRMDRVKIQTGDVLLLQGRSHLLDGTLRIMGCLPLADRGYSVGRQRKLIPALAIFGGAIAMTVAGLVPVQAAFALAALAMALTGLLPVRTIYEHVDWPVIVLLGAMLPVGAALESTGGAQTVADILLSAGKALPAWAALAVLIPVTMVLTGAINNAATVVLMAPIALSVAQGMGAQPDPFLMAVAVGASSAFLTPIGHQSNTLVMGPGGYAFGDYLRMGVPMSLLVAGLSVPLILFFWPA